jgi:hypothetical protein
MSTEQIIQKVKSLTSTEKWGSARSDMADLARLVKSQEQATALVETIMSRLMDLSDALIPFKAVELAEYLVLNADQGLAVFLVNRARPTLEHVARSSEREGTRAKALAVLRIVNDPNEWEQQRAKAQQIRAKFSNQAISSSQSGQYQHQQYSSSQVQHSAPVYEQSSSLKKQWSKDDYEDANVNVRIADKKSKNKKSSGNQSRTTSERNHVHTIEPAADQAQSLFGPGMVVRPPVESEPHVLQTNSGSSFGFMSTQNEEHNTGFDFIHSGSQNNAPTNLVSNANNIDGPKIGFLAAIPDGKPQNSFQKGFNTAVKQTNAPFVDFISPDLIGILNSAPPPKANLSIDDLLGANADPVVSENSDLLSMAAKDKMEIDEDEFEVVQTLNGEKRLKKKVVKTADSKVRVDADPWNNGLVNLNALNTPVKKKEVDKPKRLVDPLDPFSGL